MAAGLRDLLALQGVIPLSKPVVTSTAGLTLGQASGVWVSGVPTATGSTPGLTLAQASGVWITGGNPSIVAPNPGIALLQSMGVWITGSPAGVAPQPDTKRERPASYAGGAEEIDYLYEQLLREDEELMLFVMAAMRVIQ